MRPTELLSSEHRLIEVMLEVLDRMVEKALADGRLERQPAEEAVAFIKGFADGCHHGKEETHLFTMMVDKGFPREQGPIAVMLMEHEQGRAHVRGMAEHIAAAASGEAEALQAFAAHANGYVNLLRAHIHKEDHILFPMADRALSPEDQDRLMVQFDKVEAEEMGAGTHDSFLQMAKQLAQRYGVETGPSDDMHMPHSNGQAHQEH